MEVGFSRPAGLLELACIEKLLGTCPEASGREPMTAEDLLRVGGAALDPLFHEPPIGPIPDCLAPHMSVHACVAGYEEKYDELDRWKAMELGRWLKAMAGTPWNAGSRVYELLVDSESGAPERFLFKLVPE